jgi:crossover junction endodeoxyribonuclease RuvC
MTKPKRYIGLDISMTGPGFACVEVVDRRANLLATDTITTVKTTVKTVNKVKVTTTYSDGKRLRKLAVKLKNFMAEYGPADEIIKEASFHQFKTATGQIFKTVGVYEYILHEQDIIEYAATTIKKTVTGSGKASKTEVAEKICAYLGLPLDTFEDRDDESDAVGVVFTHLIKKKLIDWEDFK